MAMHVAVKHDGGREREGRWREGEKVREGGNGEGEGVSPVMATVCVCGLQ